MDAKGPELSSPPWQSSTRLVAGLLLIGLAAVLVFSLRQLVVTLILASLLAYVLNPLVGRLRRAGLPRWASVLLIYLGIFLIVALATTGVGLAIWQDLAGLVADLQALSAQLPGLLKDLTQLKISIGPWTIDISQMDVFEATLTWIGGSLQPIFSSAGGLIASLAGATASLIGFILLGIVLSIYLLLDYGIVGQSAIRLVPGPYRRDFELLFQRTGLVWQAFFRGQLILGLAVGVMTIVVFSVLGVRFSLGLGIVAGILEFVPNFGPFIAGLVAVLVALFQGTNLWGLSALPYALLVAAGAIVIQQIENNLLVPRIIGQSLRLHPIVVLLATLAGAILAGLVGVLLAAPTVATLRLWLGYVYCKTAGTEPWAPPTYEPQVGVRRGRPIWDRLRRKKAQKPASDTRKDPT